LPNKGSYLARIALINYAPLSSAGLKGTSELARMTDTTELIDRLGLENGRKILVEHTICACGPTSVRLRIVLDPSWNHEKHNAITVPTERPGWLASVCPKEDLRAARRDRIPFLIVLGERAITRSEEELVITLAHELEHVKQESVYPGMMHVGTALYHFVQEKRDQHGIDIQCVHEMPVEYHAELAGAKCATALVGMERVREFYNSQDECRQKIPDLLKQAGSSDPAADLAQFLTNYWSQFVDWYNEAIRPQLPALSNIDAFRKRYQPFE